jgi:hypothetical protein
MFTKSPSHIHYNLADLLLARSWAATIQSLDYNFHFEGAFGRDPDFCRNVSDPDSREMFWMMNQTHFVKLFRCYFGFYAIFFIKRIISYK